MPRPNHEARRQIIAAIPAKKFARPPLHQMVSRAAGGDGSDRVVRLVLHLGPRAGELSVPVDYGEDSLMVMGWIQSAAEGDFVPFLSKDIHRLGTPYVGNWNDWPVWGEELIYGLGLLARWVGLFQAANYGVLLGHLVSALAFCFCCRLMRFRCEWSFVAAILFSFTCFHTYRSLHHLLHVYSHTVPLAILTAPSHDQLGIELVV